MNLGNFQSTGSFCSCTLWVYWPKIGIFMPCLVLCRPHCCLPHRVLVTRPQNQDRNCSKFQIKRTLKEKTDTSHIVPPVLLNFFFNKTHTHKDPNEPRAVPSLLIFLHFVWVLLAVVPCMLSCCLAAVVLLFLFVFLLWILFCCCIAWCCCLLATNPMLVYKTFTKHLVSHWILLDCTLVLGVFGNVWVCAVVFVNFLFERLCRDRFQGHFSLKIKVE